MIKKFRLENPTTRLSVELTLYNGDILIGYFEEFDDSLELEKQDLYYFIKNQNNSNFIQNRDKKFATIINQNEVQSIRKL